MTEMKLNVVKTDLMRIQPLRALFLQETNSTMLFEFAHNINADAVLFEDHAACVAHARKDTATLRIM